MRARVEKVDVLGWNQSNGLILSPGVQRKFSSQTEDIFNGNELCHRLFYGVKGLWRQQ